jgi:hypothetical protein
MWSVDTISPEGKTVAHYSGNLLVTAGKATKLVPFALNDQPSSLDDPGKCSAEQGNDGGAKGRALISAK